jgi:hypothetical protein
MSFVVEDYFNKKMLAKLGINYELEDLEQWEVEAYSIIENTINEEQNREMKKKR